MRVSVICTGTELLKGTTVNTNLTFVGQQLGEAGIVPFRALVVGDSFADLRQALESAAGDSDLIITTGGLGPTRDDLTRNAVCDFLKLKLHRDLEIEAHLIRRWANRHSTAPDKDYLSQADVPENSIVLKNHVGTAPGLWVKGETEIILLPGPPDELNPMFENEAMPLLKKLVAEANFTSSFMITSISELIVQGKVEPLVKGLPLSLAYCSSVEGVKVFFSGGDENLIVQKAEEAKKLFGDAVLADNKLSLVEEISERLRGLSYTLGTAESCTGGMIAAAITDLPGSSQIFSGSIVSYSNAVKTKLSGVPQEILETHGAVSSECVSAMVSGVAKALDVDAAIAVSGIAGPDGGTDEKPVGLVYIAALLHDKIIVSKHIFPGNRDSIRNRAKIRG
ncbi:MAG: CinA family nicotinamide mononucleotide deamidase-related protein, partial [Victivallaceae bacterium]|nr:CinA family nicotinamide mononucleotide deamidase-related protein [Victivallaceae bacterium]